MNIKIIISLIAILSFLAINQNLYSRSPMFNKAEKNTEKTEKIDKIDKKKFWNEIVVPILKKDKKTLKKIIHFPLKGSWAQNMGFKKVETKVKASEFFANYEKLFDKNCIKKLSELKYKDVQIYIGDGYTQLIVSNGWEIPYITKTGRKSHVEGGIILNFKKIKNKWKLFSIKSMN